MERCSHCQHELTPGFDFCHQCGASTRSPATAQDSKIQQVVEVVDQIKGLGDQVSRTGQSAKQAVDQYLGSPISTQRQLIYALVTALAIVLSVGSNPFTGKALAWFESWLLLAIFFLPIIRYQITGLFPFANLVNTLLGDVQSLRRRLLLASFWTFGPSLLVIFALGFLVATLSGSFESWSQQLGAETASIATDPAFTTPTSGNETISVSEATTKLLAFLSTLLGSFLINFYLMGFATHWRQVQDLGDYSLGSRLVQQVDRTAASIQDKVRQLEIRDLEISTIEMKALRRFTAGESSGRRGQQLVITRGRARVVVFVQDYGSGLFVRWSSYYDASGRRLWVLYGMLISFLNQFVLRWTGNNLIEIWQTIVGLLAPVGAGRDAVDYNGNSFFAQLLSLPESVSEYSWNDVFALESSVRDCIEKVLEEVQASHQEAEIIRSRNELQGQLEASAAARRPSFSNLSTSPHGLTP